MGTVVMRVEHAKTRDGVFWSGGVSEAVVAAQIIHGAHIVPFPGRHPTPPNDGISDFCGGIDYCACRSVDEVRTWFHPAVLRQLARMGYRLALYETDTIKHGGVQCAFPLGKARFLGLFPLPVSRNAA